MVVRHFVLDKDKSFHPLINALDCRFRKNVVKSGFDDPNGDYINDNPDDVSINYGDLNSNRLPWYSRFDISVKRKFVLGENSILEANFSVTNLLNRENIFYLDRVSQERVDQLPIMPSLGASLSF